MERVALNPDSIALPVDNRFRVPIIERTLDACLIRPLHKVACT